MTSLRIVENPHEFQEVFLSRIPKSKLDTIYGSVIRSLLYFIWKGSYQTVNNIENIQPELGLLCLSTYKALLPVVHLIRLGYNADAFVLLRAVMERIALLGYLNYNRDIIQKYKEGRFKT